jgi:hypothetical protein
MVRRRGEMTPRQLDRDCSYQLEMSRRERN